MIKKILTLTAITSSFLFVSPCHSMFEDCGKDEKLDERSALAHTAAAKAQRLERKASQTSFNVFQEGSKEERDSERQTIMHGSLSVELPRNLSLVSNADGGKVLTLKNICCIMMYELYSTALENNTQIKGLHQAPALDLKNKGSVTGRMNLIYKDMLQKADDKRETQETIECIKVIVDKITPEHPPFHVKFGKHPKTQNPAALFKVEESAFFIQGPPALEPQEQKVSAKQRVKKLLGKTRKLTPKEETELCILCIDIYNEEQAKEEPNSQKVKHYLNHIATYYNDSISSTSPILDKVIKKRLGEKYRDQYITSIAAAEECNEKKDRAAKWLTLSSKSLDLAVEFGDIPSYVMWANLRLNDSKVKKEDFYKAVDYMDRAAKENHPKAVEWKKNNPRPRYLGETLTSLEKNLATADLSLQWIAHGIQIICPIGSYISSFTNFSLAPILNLRTWGTYLLHTSNICGAARGTLTWYRSGDATHLTTAVFKASSVALALVATFIQKKHKEIRDSLEGLKD
jgi:outer membrane murein-binding lipoprotein Lpp